MGLRLASFAAGIVVVLSGIGCAAEKFTRDRFEMVEVGADDREDVRHLLGKPEFDAGDEWYYENQKRHYSARVFYDAAGRVRGKEWMNAKTGAWEGKHPDVADPPAGEVRERHESRTRIDDD